MKKELLSSVAFISLSAASIPLAMSASADEVNIQYYSVRIKVIGTGYGAHNATEHTYGYNVSISNPGSGASS